MNESTTKRTFANPKITDIEDGFQYYSAVDARCTVIVSYDERDFHFSELEVLYAEEFLMMYAVRKK